MKGSWKVFVACLLVANVHAAEPPLQTTLTEIRPRIAAPSLALTDMDDKPVSLAAFKGKVVLVNFWATWCPPCRREFPSMERLRRKLAAEDFVVLGVDVGEDPDTISAFVSTLDLQPEFPIVLDRDSTALSAWPVRGLPTTFIVDRQGRLVEGKLETRRLDHLD